jgi:anhydro-N-acetylmuramic acid kinase
MENQYHVTGLMSGSSLDGIDLACCEFFHDREKWNYRILQAQTFPYPPLLLEKLQKAIEWSGPALERLDRETGAYYAEVLNQFHTDQNLNPDLISSHGHTIFHDPTNRITLQIGNGRLMADASGVTVVNNFRSEDVSLGGQGAPLVPVGDKLLFAEYQACLNLGGFANISYDDANCRRVAFDISPANMALNWLANKDGKTYDNEGSLARTGQINSQLLGKLNSLEYYRAPAPKSLGKEWFEGRFKPLLEMAVIPIKDKMATVVEHVAVQVGKGLISSGDGSVLVTGGGALNLYLVERIRKHTIAKLVLPDHLLIEFKEALIFALLGLLRIRGEINCLASVTGGPRDLCTGNIYLP